MIINNKSLKLIYSKGIKKEIARYNRKAQATNQGTLNSTWVKYVLKTSKDQWNEVLSGSDAISLDRYKNILKRIHISEKRVFGSQPKLKTQTQDSLSQSKQNLKNLLNKSKKSVQSKYKITKVAVQKKNKHRFNIFINNRYAFPVSEDVLIQYHLYKGKSITHKLKLKINKADNVSKLYDYSLNVLDHHPKTAYEMAQRLRRFTKNNEDINKVITKLKDIHLLNDQQYADAFVRDQLALNAKGSLVIRHKLQRKHVSSIKINKALDENYKSSRAIQNGLKQAKLKFKFMHSDSFHKQINKIKRFLLRRGYSFDEITKIMNKANFHPDKKSQRKILDKKTQQALRRYNRYDRYKMINKVKSYLLRQGFSFDEISASLDRYL